MSGLLLDGNGNPWMTDDGRTVPKRCPICGADMGLFFAGEPVFLCKRNEKHYYGTLEFVLDDTDRKESGLIAED